MSPEDIVPTPVSGKTQFVTKHLNAGCGLSILPVPVFDSLDTSYSTKSIDLSIKIQPKLTLPGAKDPITLTIDLGKISIARPSIALPQVMLMFSDGLSSAVQSDVLVAMDPATGHQKPSLEVVLTPLFSCTEVRLTQVFHLASQEPRYATGSVVATSLAVLQRIAE